MIIGNLYLILMETFSVSVNLSFIMDVGDNEKENL
uniref:Uncharacterized protein n=1 Tax=Nelumbo nucifera TaxID=4432 RepID=A0A822YRA2_NELNU|nr:TPA_asm: hypothetical protein HUJ06_012177 [Nelumbo nucifera]